MGHNTSRPGFSATASMLLMGVIFSVCTCGYLVQKYRSSLQNNHSSTIFTGIVTTDGCTSIVIGDTGCDIVVNRRDVVALVHGNILPANAPWGRTIGFDVNQDITGSKVVVYAHHDDLHSYSLSDTSYYVELLK